LCATPSTSPSRPAGSPRRSRRGEPPDPALILEHLDPARLRPWLAKQIWHRQPATRLRPLAPPAVALDTPVDVAPGPLLWLAPKPDGCRVELGLGDRELDLPSEARPFLADLLARPTSFVAQRAGGELDEVSRRVVLNRLAAEGVVVPARP
jgi:hypothetical protein